jgi:hypothetical protein
MIDRISGERLRVLKNLVARVMSRFEQAIGAGVRVVRDGAKIERESSVQHEKSIDTVRWRSAGAQPVSPP